MVVVTKAMDLAMPQVLRAIVAERPDSDGEPADRAVAERCLAGERDAFAILVARHGQAVFAFCTRLVGTSLAEEIAQETLARAWSRLGEFRWESSFRSWLFRIGLNLCRDHLKSGRAREDAAGRSPGLLESLDPAPGPEDRILGREAARKLERALGRIPPKYREAFVLKHVENLSYLQMREVVGMEVPALKVRVHRARAMLKELMDDEDSGPEGGEPPDRGRARAQRKEEGEP